MFPPGLYGPLSLLALASRSRWERARFHIAQSLFLDGSPTPGEVAVRRGAVSGSAAWLGRFRPVAGRLFALRVFSRTGLVSRRRRPLQPRAAEMVRFPSSRGPCPGRLERGEMTAQAGKTTGTGREGRGWQPARGFDASLTRFSCRPGLSKLAATPGGLEPVCPLLVPDGRPTPARRPLLVVGNCVCFAGGGGKRHDLVDSMANKLHRKRQIYPCGSIAASLASTTY